MASAPLSFEARLGMSLDDIIASKAKVKKTMSGVEEEEEAEEEESVDARWGRRQ